jgi:hypothetical protein
VWQFVSHKRGAHDALAGAEARFAGKVINPVPGYKWDSHSKTLILALRKGCEFCEASMPFYRRLSAIEHEGKASAHLLAIMPDNKTSGSEVLRTAGIEIESVFEQPLKSIQVLGTPTLLLLDASGKVEKAWVGQLSPDGEAEVIAALAR